MRKQDYIKNKIPNNNYYTNNTSKKEYLNNKQTLKNGYNLCDESHIKDGEISHERTNFTLQLLRSREKIYKPDYFKIEDISEEELKEINIIHEKEEEITFEKIEKVRKTLGKFNLTFDLILYNLEFEVIFFTHKLREIFTEDVSINILNETIKSCFNVIDSKLETNQIYIRSMQHPTRNTGSLFRNFSIDLVKNLKQEKPEIFEVYKDKLLSQLKIISNQNNLPSQEEIDRITSYLKSSKANRKVSIEDINHEDLKYYIFFLTRRNKPLFQDILFRKEIIEELERYLKESSHSKEIKKYKYQFTNNSIYFEIESKPSFRINDFVPGLKKYLSKYTNKNNKNKLKSISMFTRSYMLSNIKFEEFEIQDFIEFHYNNFFKKKYF